MPLPKQNFPEKGGWDATGRRDYTVLRRFRGKNSTLTAKPPLRVDLAPESLWETTPAYPGAPP